MTGSLRVTRRDFIAHCTRRGAVLAAAPLILSARARAQAGQPGPNDRVGVGFIGCGREGGGLRPHLPPDAEIVAIADVNEARLAQFAGDQPWKRYTDYRELLDSADVDAVVIATPDHWHALNGYHACQAGKDAYVEKPLTLTVREGRILVEAARKHGRIVQTGSQQRSMPDCVEGCRLVREGRVGKIHTVHGANYPSPWECALPVEPVPEGLNWDMWLGPTGVRGYHQDIYLPRANPGWISFRPWSGGEMTGWGSHGLDLILWALDLDHSGPVEVWPEEGAVLTRPVSFRFADGTLLHLDGKGPAGGGLFKGENGEILVDRGLYTVRDADQPEPEKPAPASGGPAEHLKNWIDCVRSREKPIADVEIGHRAATMCHLGNIARWAGRKLQWDPEKEQFVGDDEANLYLERPMREPWTF